MRKPPPVEIVNETRGTIVGNRIGLAETALTRLVGLLGKSNLTPGSGLLIRPSSGVHTFGMRFPIDVVSLDRDLRVQGVWENLGPFRVAALSLKTRAVLELPVGAIRDSHIKVADRLAIRNPSDGQLEQHRP